MSKVLLNTIKEENILTINKSVSKEEVIEELAHHLHCKGYVRQEYINSVLDRETNYPTGLPTNTYGIAIPHADSINVIETSIAVAILNEDTLFSEMGGSEQSDNIPVRLVFLLAIKDPSKQLQLLQEIVELISNEHIVKNIVDNQEVLSYL